MIEKVLTHIDGNHKTHVDRLGELLRIPSISTDPQRKADIRRAAEWVHCVLDACGFQAEIIDTPGHPCIIADSGPADGAPTLLIYGHYDVQPTGDEGLWDSPPFEPTIRDGQLYARGAADDKGQVLTHVFAAEAWTKATGKLPVRLKFLIEGEEEISSPHLEPVLRSHSDRLACDWVALSDTPKFDRHTPAITYGTKGMVYKEIILTGPKQNLHSGSYGGIIANPGNAAAAIIASLKDAENRVTIPAFYADVRDVTDADRQRIRELPFDEPALLEGMGAPSYEGEKGYTTLERRWCRPTLDVNGLYGGFMGEGASTVIPAKIGAKISMRLVPDQDPEKVSQAFDKAVHDACPPGVRLQILNHGRCPAYVAPLDSPAMKAAEAAVTAGWGKPPLFIREGGTLPILPLFKEVLGAESIMLGFCAPDCNAHGPNEFFGIDDLHNGTRTAACLIDQLSKL